MTHELAKQLKDAGFSNEYHWGAYLSPNGKRTEYLPRPTLSELIEACGDDFLDLSKVKGHKLFRASAWIGAYLHALDGSTPEEAVAKLWLAINKK